MRASTFPLIAALLMAVTPLGAQNVSPFERVQAFDLDTLQAGNVTVHYPPSERARAEELANLARDASAFFERELGVSFELGVVALTPEDWFEPIPGVPYAVPWNWVPDRLIFVPSSLAEGVLVRGRGDRTERRRIVDFIMLHEYGHLATKEYFLSGTDHDDVPISWFDELLANVFAYAFVRSTDPAWAQAGREMWAGVVESSTPATLSLDWSFMNELPPDELVRTYGWYQNMLNLRAAELYDEHGLDFLRALKSELDWDQMSDWTTASLLSALEEIAPGFRHWAESLGTDG